MSKQVFLSDDEIDLINLSMNGAWNKLNKDRMLVRPDSPEERQLVERQREIEVLKAKLG